MAGSLNSGQSEQLMPIPNPAVPHPVQQVLGVLVLGVLVLGVLGFLDYGCDSVLNRYCRFPRSVCPVKSPVFLWL